MFLIYIVHIYKYAIMNTSVVHGRKGSFAYLIPQQLKCNVLIDNIFNSIYITFLETDLIEESN